LKPERRGGWAAAGRGADRRRPAQARERQGQLAERYLRLDKVDFITGTVFSNIVVAIAPT